jgi:hypothetical protein
MGKDAMSEGPALTATSKVDLATVSAVADLVINLSIAQRSHLMYGGGHPMARRGAGQARETLRRALELQRPVAIHFTAGAVFCGPHCLERGHPIFRAFADRMWRCGVAGLRFEEGTTDQDLVALIEAISEVARTHATREEAERVLTSATMPHVRIEFLRNLITYEAREEAGPVDRQAQERLWEDLMRQVAAASQRDRGTAKPGGGAGGGEEPPRQDYAAAVIDYMKQLQRVAQEDAMLQQTDLGRKVSELITRINPELRHQLMASAVFAPGATPELLQRLSVLVGQEQMVESLRRLNEAGQALPPSALRMLTMFAALGAAGQTGAAEAAPARAPARSPEELQRLLDGLLVEEDFGSRYMSPTHDKLVTNTDRHSQLGSLRPLAGGPPRFTLQAADAEHHFVKIGFELLAEPNRAPELPAVLYRESQRSFVRFASEGSVAGCRESMRLATDARAAVEKGERNPLVWTTPEVLGPLRQRLAGSDRTDAEASGELLAEIGEPAIPVLLAVLAEDASIPARKRAIEALVAMRVDPAPHLLPLLAADQLWYLQRNAFVVLRRRRDGRGLTAAKRLWGAADPRLKLEILRYVVELEDADRFTLLRTAITDRNGEVALAAIRMAVSSGDAATFAAVVQLADTTRALEVGGPFHLDVLRLLAQASDPAGRRYVETVTSRRKPLMPWLRERYRRDVAELLREGR